MYSNRFLETLLRGAEPGTLRTKVLKAGLWSVAGYGAAMIIRLVSNLIMSRLLAPELFGVMAIATIVMIGLALFSDLGLRQNIIQSERGTNPAFLDTAWSIQIVRGFALWGFAAATGTALYFARQAGLVPHDSVYANPLLPGVIALVGAGTILGGFTSTKWAEANRNLAFGKVTRIELASQLFGFLLMLAWAYFDKSIWALVFGGLGATCVRVLLSHLTLPGHSNHFRFDRGAAQEIFGFGRWILFSSIVGFLVANGDRLILGGLLSEVDFGICVIAFLIYGAVEQVLVRVVNDVSLPVLSQIARNQQDELSAKYYKLHFGLASLTYFLAGVLSASAEQLVCLLYDYRYLQAGWMLGILSFGLVCIPSQLAIQCCLAIGRPAVQLQVLVTRLIGLLVFPYISFRLFGIGGALWGLVASQFLAAAATFFSTRSFGFLHLRDEIRPAPSFLLGLLAGLILDVATHFFTSMMHPTT